jgi:tetratricopeptide (TPR) repeat protein
MAADDDEDPSREGRYKRRIGITLATLAFVGGWIAVLQTNASTNESRTTREATRLAAEAETADVVDKGLHRGLAQIEAETDTFESRPVFGMLQESVADAGGTLDPAQQQQRLDEALASVEASLDLDPERLTAVSEEAASLSLEQVAVVEQRITWNARASQYETVMTTLAVAIFLIGFTMVVARRTRPPFVGPGLALAVFCFGWAIHIYLKPIPDVAPEAIDATAAGQVALEDGRPEDAIGRFEDAVEADDGYAPAHAGLGLSRLVAANPDLLRNFAITDDEPVVVESAAATIDTALEMGGDRDPTTLTYAALTEIVRGNWDRAAELLERAIELNARTPGLGLARSAVAVGQGESALADEWSARAVDQVADQVGTDTNQSLASQYLTLLEWVQFREPTRAGLATRMRDQAIAQIAAARAALDGREVPEPVDQPTQLQIDAVDFSDGVTTVALAPVALPPGASVVVAGYERPAPDAPWVQPAELFYVGPPGDGSGVTLDTERACVAVEYRFDLYVNGRFVDSAIAAGGPATC